MKQVITIIAILLMHSYAQIYAQQRKSSSATRSSQSSQGAKKQTPAEDPCIEHEQKTYSWKLNPYTGEVYRVAVDTSFINFFNTDVEDSYAIAYNYLANYGLPGESRILSQREETPEFIFMKAYDRFNVSPAKMRYYNTQIPYTKATYLTGGSKINAEERLTIDFAGNANKNWGFGADLDFTYTRGFYNSQGVNSLNWQVYTSYIGEKYQMHAYANTANFSNQENGGISDANYILRPETVNENLSDPKNIPTNLQNAWNRIKHKDYYFSQRYSLGFYREQLDAEGDTLGIKEYIPVTTFFHTAHFEHNFRRFIIEKGGVIESDFFQNTYMDEDATNDTLRYWSLKNTVGIALNEGFNKYSKFGLSAFLTLENRRYTNMTFSPGLDYILVPGDNIYGEDFTLEDKVNLNYMHRKQTESILWLGGELSKQKGSILTYNADVRFGMAGYNLGDMHLRGWLQTKIPLGKDSLEFRAKGEFHNSEPSYYYQYYYSNHFRWQNSFDKERRMKVYGEIALPRTRTSISAGVENITNYLYFNNNALAAQYGGDVQVFSAILKQDFKAGILNWCNSISYQKSSQQDILPLPDLSVYSQLYLDFKIAKVLHTQFGFDCYYNTKYYSPVYQPATQMFHTQSEQQTGNYPLINVYANMKLKQVRFFAMFYHVNQGMFSNDYFAAPGYPLNPRFFKFGVSVDFSN